MDPIWEQLFSNRQWGKYPAEDLIRTVMRAFKDKDIPKLSVLEVGCGAGANLSFFLNEGFQVYGVDGAPSAIKSAKNRLEKFRFDGQTLDLQVRNFTDLPFENETFDIVVDYLAVYTNKWQDIEQSFSECYRVLKPGGFVYSRSWAEGCSGFDTGEVIELGTSANPTKGPCKQMGTSHFFTLNEIDKIFTGYSNRHVRKSTVLDIKTGEEDIEWIVWAEK